MVDSEKPANADELIALVTQEKFDAISTIDKADKKCEDHILVCNFLINLLNEKKNTKNLTKLHWHFTD